MIFLNVRNRFCRFNAAAARESTRLALLATHLGHFKQWPHEWWHFDFVGSGIFD